MQNKYAVGQKIGYARKKNFDAFKVALDNFLHYFKVEVLVDKLVMSKNKNFNIEKEKNRGSNKSRAMKNMKEKKEKV